MEANLAVRMVNITKTFSHVVANNNITLEIRRGEILSLLGENGSGKTTLMNMLSGIYFPDSGQIYVNGEEVSIASPKDALDLHIGMIHQHFKLVDVFTAAENIILGLNEKAVLDLNGVRRAVKEICDRYGFVIDPDKKVYDMSVSEKQTLEIVKVLYRGADILILDEPTNHLDLDMTEWLEDYLRRTNLTLLMVTHDRYFLDRVCSEIIEIDNRRIYQYKGNYSYYLEKREERIEAKTVEIERANNLYRTELEWMRRMPQARGHKARYREDAFYELEKVAKQRFNNDNVKLDVKASYIGSKIFEADHLYKSFGDLKILDDFSYIFARYEKMGIVGNNGTGKSTFIKILMRHEQADRGALDIGETVRFGYYSQDGLQFDEQMKVIDVVQDIAEVIELGNGKRLTASQFLQHFLFTPETQHSYVYKLSGGERRRLYLCTVLMRNPNFLVLDEPTNDLDIVTLNVLEEYLRNFKGCVIVVSHDRYFMDKVVDHLLVFNGQGDIRDFPGNYTRYRDWKDAKAAQEREKEKEAAKAQEEKTAKVRLNEKRRMSFKEKREFEQLEQDIAALEAEKQSIEEALCSGALSVDELTEKSKRLPELADLIDEKTMRWLELSEIESN